MARKKRIRVGSAKDAPLFAGGMLNPEDRAYMKSEFLHAMQQPGFDIEEWHAGDVAAAMKSDADQPHEPKLLDDPRDMLNEGNFEPVQQPLPDVGTGIEGAWNSDPAVEAQTEENQPASEPVEDEDTSGLEDTSEASGLESEAAITA